MGFYHKLIHRNEAPYEEDKYKGINGWLLVPAISMLTTPLMLAGLIFVNFNMLNNSLITQITAEYPGYRAAMISQTLIVAMQLVFVVYVATLFFRRRKNLPTMIIAFLTIHLLIIIANLSWIYTTFREINYSEYTGVTFAMIMLAFGVPYFMKSRRVKATFINL